MGDRLRDKVAVITGAAHGIGLATAGKMLREGASVVLADIQGEAVRRSAEAVSALGPVLAVEVDVSRRDQVENMVERTVECFGRLDILANNAGLVRPASFEEATEDDWDAVVGVNLKGAFFCARAAVPRMKAVGGGKMVNIGSRAALGKWGRTVYGTTKAGLSGFTRTLALELAPSRINVNCIGPGPIATEMFRAANPPDSERTRAIVRGIPLGRMGQPEDVANLIVFLCSEEASFITGQTIYCCGGLTVGAVPG